MPRYETKGWVVIEADDLESAREVRKHLEGIEITAYVNDAYDVPTLRHLGTLSLEDSDLEEVEEDDE